MAHLREIEKIAAIVFQKIKPTSKILIDYDEREDVLYINFLNSDAQKADFGRRFGDYVIRIKDGLVVGVTIISAMRHYQKGFEDMPPILKEPVTLVLA